MKFPKIIQGGMGVGVSDWRLARAVSSHGQMGVVSGTAIDLVLTRRLQSGDPGGHMRRALAALPDQGIARRVLDCYFIEDGKPPHLPFKAKPMVNQKPSRQLEELLIAANFVEVFLAKENHNGMVGINFLHKIQAPLLPSLFGAMLAGVDVIIVGAGIPLEIPDVLEKLVRFEPVDVKLHVKSAEKGSSHKLSFDPNTVFDAPVPTLKRPLFFPIVSSATLASVMVRKCGGRVDGLIVEDPSAGGHNAPPRGIAKLSELGEPVYGPRDVLDLDTIKSLGLPFWLAGSYGSPEKISQALEAGATGVQVGTLFAFCEESGLRPDIKRDTIESCLHGTQRIFTDPLASPTGFPFKVLSIPGTLSDPELYAKRNRICDLGYLREAYERPDGSIAWRCPAEDPETYVRTGGPLEDTVGRKCLCNGLMANIGLAQVRNGDGEEQPLLTCGDDLPTILNVLAPGGKTSYSSSDAIDYMLEC